MVARSANVHGSDGPLAEFSALKQEALQRQGQQHNIFVLQVTISGAVFSFSLSAVNRAPFLLAIPFITYALAARYYSHHLAIFRISEYVENHLDSQIPGGLSWTAWRRNSLKRTTMLSLANPLAVVFPGISLGAIIWSGSYIVASSQRSVVDRIGLGVILIFGAVFTALAAYIVRKLSWEHR